MPLSPPEIRQDIEVDYQYAKKAFIKQIYLPLPGYKFDHHPIGDGEEKDKEIFLGREKIVDKLVSMLLEGDGKGSYLVTGYRGMGKTSFVRKAIKKYQKIEEGKDNTWNAQHGVASQKYKVQHWHISFAQNDLLEIDILRQITKFLKDDLTHNLRLKFIRYAERRSTILLLASIIFLPLFLFEKPEGFDFIFSSSYSLTNSLVLSLASGFTIYQLLQFALFLARVASPNLEHLVSTYRQIDILYDRCQGEISNESGMEGSSEQIPLGFIDKRSKKYQPLNAKEAEHELIEILRQYKGIIFFELFSWIHWIVAIFVPSGLLYFMWHEYTSVEESMPYFKPAYWLFAICSLISIVSFTLVLYRHWEWEFSLTISTFKKKFIFVFDELDKLDPITGKGYFYENTAAATNMHYNTYTNDLRKRKELVVNLLASLKYFITEADARFIFIAGREMFDASLADIADRQSSISSVFHQVIYVDSFYRDKPGVRPNASGVGEMVESYLEEILLPERKNLDEKELKILNSKHFLANYYDYLLQAENPDTNREKILKIIFTLQNLIIYIAYRSNGSPKKMVRLLEESIVRQPNPDQDAIVVRDAYKRAKLYLKISFKKQYRLSFTSYMFRPFLLMHGSFIRRFGDSLLVSTPYLIDNLIKFHPFAFSAKNLELLPEVISSSKTPELRAFIEELISFLGQNHLRETESGLFEYKFYDRTHNEIAYISKISEEESAAFNFTLDENYPIKRHLAARVKELRAAHKDFQDENNHYSMSLAFLNDLLGDAEMYDDEFEDAIISYSDALQLLPKGGGSKNLSSEQQVLFVRVKLKLGLTYEKMKAFDFALAHYVDAFIHVRDILCNGQTRDTIFEEYKIKPPIAYRELLQLASHSLAALTYVQEKLDEGITFQKMADFSLSFQSLIKQFGKTKFAGRDIIEAKHYAQIAILAYYKNLAFPFNFLDSGEQKMDNISAKLTKLFDCTPSDFINFVKNSVAELKIGYGKVLFSMGKQGESRDFRFSFMAYIYYKKCLSSYIGINGQNSDLHHLAGRCQEMMFSFENTHDKNLLWGIGNTLTRMGDLLFTLYKDKNDGNSTSPAILVLVRNNYYSQNGSKIKTLIARLDFSFNEYFKLASCSPFAEKDGEVSLDYILFLYYLAGRFYLKGGRSNSCSFQLRKMLLIIRSFGKLDTDTVNWVESTLSRKILEISSWNAHTSDRAQILKYKDYMQIETFMTPPEYSRHIYNNLSNSTENKDAILMIAAMTVKIGDYSEKKYPTLMDFMDNCPEQNLITPYNGVTHQMTRLLELELQVSMNLRFLEKNLSVRFDRFLKSHNPEVTLATWKEFYASVELKTDRVINDYDFLKNNMNGRKSNLLAIRMKIVDSTGNFRPFSSEKEKTSILIKEYFELTVNSIHCLHQIIHILKVYGINHFLNSAYLGVFHQRMGDWLKHYRLCRVLAAELHLDLNFNVFDKLLGFRVIHTLDVLPQYQLALQHYYQSLQVHSEGSAYKFQINNFIYLEDDYNDNLNHFGAALERQRINSGAIRDKIDYLLKEMSTAGVLKYSNYVNNQPF